MDPTLLCSTTEPTKVADRLDWLRCVSVVNETFCAAKRRLGELLFEPRAAENTGDEVIALEARALGR